MVAEVWNLPHAGCSLGSREPGRLGVEECSGQNCALGVHLVPFHLLRVGICLPLLGSFQVIMCCPQPSARSFLQCDLGCGVVSSLTHSSVSPQ